MYKELGETQRRKNVDDKIVKDVNKCCRIFEKCFVLENCVQ